MKALSASIALALLAATPALAGDAAKKARSEKFAPAKPESAQSSAAKADAVTITPKDIKWSDAPPDLPKGAQMSVLHGDPTKKQQFALRFKMPTGYKIPPHWHTNDEQLTILSGTFLLRMGDSMDAPAHELGPASFHYLPAKMHHAAEAKSETIVQVDGMGPFDIHYVNPADNPKNKEAAK
jgi:quercetin dioxygenase-like cupin family protein